MVTAPVVLLPFGLLLFGGSWESLPRQLGFIQALMILVAIGYDFYFADGRDLSGVDGEKRRAHLALQQLRRFWRLLLASWCCLYLTLPFSQWFAPLAAQTPSWQWQAIQVTATFLNNASALMLVLCYLVLNRPTVIRVADREVENVSLRPGLVVILTVGLVGSDTDRAVRSLRFTGRICGHSVSHLICSAASRAGSPWRFASAVSIAGCSARRVCCR